MPFLAHFFFSISVELFERATTDSYDTFTAGGPPAILVSGLLERIWKIWLGLLERTFFQVVMLSGEISDLLLTLRAQKARHRPLYKGVRLLDGPNHCSKSTFSLPVSFATFIPLPRRFATLLYLTFSAIYIDGKNTPKRGRTDKTPTTDYPPPPPPASCNVGFEVVVVMSSSCCVCDSR